MYKYSKSKDFKWKIIEDDNLLWLSLSAQYGPVTLLKLDYIQLTSLQNKDLRNHRPSVMTHNNNSLNRCHDLSHPRIIIQCSEATAAIFSSIIRLVVCVETYRTIHSNIKIFYFSRQCKTSTRQCSECYLLHVIRLKPGLFLKIILYLFLIVYIFIGFAEEIMMSWEFTSTLA